MKYDVFQAFLYQSDDLLMYTILSSGDEIKLNYFYLNIFEAT